jgi:hypothetical protein
MGSIATGTFMTSKVYGFVGNELSPIAIMTKLKDERKLTDAEIDRCGLRVLAATDFSKEIGRTEPNPAVRIPYYGLSGEDLLDNRGNQLARYRRSVADGKGGRYTQGAGTGARHYLARTQSSWADVASDVSVPVFYTEGEFKGIAGCKHLGPTIANAGVSAWRGFNGNLAAPLDEFEWKGRLVYIVYDAETTATPAVPLKRTVALAAGELAVDLQVRGASVKCLYIARTSFYKAGIKLGLDDYFNAGGTKEALLATQADPDVDEDWSRMFKNYAVFLGSRPHIKNIADGHVYSAKEFADYIETSVRIVDGKKVKTANVYRDHPERNVIREYVFDPRLGVGYQRDEQKFNTWTGFSVQPAVSKNYETNVQTYLEFQRGVWGEQYMDFFLDWAAHCFQRPWELTTISPILVSRVKGVGKSLTGLVLRALIGTRGSFVGSVEGLTEKHTGELEGKLFVQVDEADALFDGKESRLKALDSDEIRIRKMNTDGYTVKNIMRKFYTTNANAAFRIAEDERRYYVVRVDKTSEDGKEESDWSVFLRTKIVPMSKSPEALSDLMEYFMRRDIAHWDPGAPVPRTEAMMDMVEAGESKKDTIAHQVYDAVRKNPWWVTDKNITSQDVKMWGEVKALLKDSGGRSVQHVYKTEGEVKSVTVWLPEAASWK